MSDVSHHPPSSFPVTVAEDDPEDRLLIREAWEEGGSGRPLEFVSGGQELLDALHEAAKAILPSLVILDLNMPGTDGRSVLREVRAAPVLRRVPMVVLSTSRAEEDVALAYELGASSYVVKPHTFEELVRVLRCLESYWFGCVELPPRRC